MTRKNLPEILIQFTLPREEDAEFKAFLRNVRRNRSVVLRMLVNHLTGAWKRRLGPEGWKKFMKGELTPDEMQDIYRRSVKPHEPPALLVVGAEPLFPDSDVA